MVTFNTEKAKSDSATESTISLRRIVSQITAQKGFRQSYQCGERAGAASRWFAPLLSPSMHEGWPGLVVIVTKLEDCLTG